VSAIVYDFLVRGLAGAGALVSRFAAAAFVGLLLADGTEAAAAATGIAGFAEDLPAVGPAGVADLLAASRRG